ncbi:MAG: hypothetical protein ACI31R_03865 [Bacilli bacterium]
MQRKLKIIRCNKIKCKKCNDIIESTYVHDFKWCSCGAVAVDGGHEYLRRLGNEEDFEELSHFIFNFPKKYIIKFLEIENLKVKNNYAGFKL